MYKKKNTLLCFSLLFFILITPILYPAIAANGGSYDYVDVNTSNVDGLADRGSHSNFSAQQYGPDSIYDTLTEDTISITYENSAESYSPIGRSSHNFNYALQQGSGKHRLVAVTVSWEDAQASASITSLTFNGVAITKAADVTVGTSYSEYISLWYLLDSTLPSSPGTYNIAVTISERITREIYVAVAEYSGVKQSAPDDYNTHANTVPGNTAITLTAAANGSIVVAGVGEGGTSALTNTNNIINLQEQILTSSGSALGHHTDVDSGSITVGWNSLSTREGMAGAVWQPASDYELNLEVQWTNADYDEANEELCIFGGTMGSEDINVDVWSDSAWINLFTDLTAGWNNISISTYLNGPTFTIRFSGDVETGDSSQDSWEIDCSLLYTWGIPPIANFSYTPQNPYTNEIITLNASTSYDPDGSIVSYFWDFGDGINDTGEVTSHSYTDNGSYTISLTVTDNDGLTSTSYDSVTVLNRLPVAAFSESSETANTGETISFNASASYDPDGSIVNYFWDFGDNSNATGVTATHIFADDGIYTITLTITDDEGATASTYSTKTILNRPPVASFTESSQTVYTGETISFNASASYDPDGSIVSYFWDFGDGTNITGIVVSHSYTDNGSYTVTLTVTDDDNATDYTTATKTVQNQPPTASFSESTTTILTSETISFNASTSYDPDGSIVSYFWDFGDGTNATGIAVDHTYVDDGTYIVTLTVTDDDDAIDLISATKTVLNRDPICSFTESAETVYTSETISFNASTSYDPDGTIVSYFWDFGDGTNASGSIVNYSYLDDGIYMVSLSVTDDDGATKVTTATKTVLNRDPVAAFTESAETVYTDEIISFNASVSYDPDGSIVSYFWDFGDGSNASGIMVSHSYVDDGFFTVTLTVIDDDSASTLITATKTIFNRDPVASFTESAQTAYTGETITFNASTSYDPDGSIISLFWDFGDGTNGTGMIITHSYLDNGTYTVTLTITDDDSASDSTSAIKTILNRSPIPNFTESTETIYTGETISFNASDSYDPDGTIIGYFWDFGDGTNTTGITTVHTYDNDGVYIVTLTVTDNDYATDSTTSTKTVLNRLPQASLTESAETVYTNEQISFNASASYDPDGSIVSYFWDFGDGTNATGMVVSHSFSNNGIFTVTLTVTDNDGAIDTEEATKTILNQPPTASFTESTTTVHTNEPILFNASTSYDLDGSIVNFFWDFGDGINATGESVSHSYLDNGTYTVTLTVTDDDGASDSADAIKTVLNQSPVASFSESAETVYTSETIFFNASASYDPDGSIVSYLWDFGDGSNATGITANHAYEYNNVYSVTLTITDDDGATVFINSSKTILNRDPLASFSESATTVYTNEIITFNASSSYDLDGSIVNFFWDFGDGINATGESVSHSYLDNGTYTVTLTVTDDDGASDSADAIKTVLNQSPVASFSESAETVYTSETIFFNASASYDPDGSIVSYLWDFGDGSNATGVLVTHFYLDDGVYVVSLSVTDDDGDTQVTTATKTVLNRDPVAAFTESTETAYIGEVITFNASASYDPDGSIINFFWDFGDGTNTTGATTSHIYTINGTYTVTLTITDDDNAGDTTNSTKTILKNELPVAIFTESAQTVNTNEPITFNASSSYDPDGSIVSYFWDFGDGTNATGIIITHIYTDNGIFTVTLTVTDDLNATDSITAEKTILNQSPIPIFTESSETVYTGETISFNASASYDPDGSIVSYFWDFSDGTNATGMVVSHSFSDDGVFTVTLTVTDDDNSAISTNSTKTVSNRAPVVSFSESTETAYTQETISFNASASYDPDGSIVSYFWAFGDGFNASGIMVSHSYVDDGFFTVTLTVTDDDGASSSVNATKTILNQSPIPIFTESSETTYTNNAIFFNASASYDPDGSIIGFFWDFGDGTNATGVTVNHIYTNNGTYTVTLTATDDDNATSEVNASKTVLNQPPIASFTESAETVYTGDAIFFNASSSYDPDGSIVGYFWDFGDGNNATGITTNHTYINNGNYTVTLTVIDDDGEVNSETATKTILNRSPIASFTESALTVPTNQEITFNASASYDVDGTITNYYWDFGDGFNATGVTSTHTYLDNGTYIVTLTVTDDDGAINSITSSKNITNRLPVASFTESSENVYTSETISFNASASYDLDGSIIGFFWDFGDGTNATGIQVQHYYNDNGTFTVTLTVTDDDGATTTATATKIVQNRLPIAIFTESAITVYTDDTITFNASSSYDPDGSIISYFWDFGDGTNATGVTTSHFYNENGDYTVTLTIIDDDEATSSTTATKTVLNRLPIPIFTESSETVLTGKMISFDASDSYDPDGSIVNYFWDFGDGTNATGISVSHAYSDNGVYIVTFIVTDDDGGASNSTATKTIQNRSPTAIFSQSATTVLTGQNIQFDASDSYDSDGIIVSYIWDFGDGTNASGVAIQHAYVDDGTYIVTLTVTDDDGATGVATATTQILNRSPVPVFIESAETVYTGEIISFNASACYDPDGSIVTYFWDFGDGTNATDMIVTHIYSENGSYTVTLTITDDDAAISTTTATKTILNRPPIAVFTESNEIVLIDEIIYFNASSSYDPDGSIVNYFWDFGDGINATGVTAEHSYSSSGAYTVTLTVTDNDDATDTTTATKTVEVTSPVAVFIESAETVYTDEVISFNASASYDPDGSIVSYFWDFGDGSNASGVTVQHAYADDGNYTVSLTVTDNDGVTDTTTAIKTVLNRAPVAQFTESTQSAYTGEIISFNASASYDPDGSIVGYLWDFGDGSNASGVTVQHAYADNGNYTITLTITDDDGTTDTTTSTKLILNLPPVSSFTESATTVYTSEVIAFNASSSYDSDGSIVSYFWDFGDGTNATGATASHAYTDDGTYTVNLTITDNDNAVSTTVATKTALNRLPAASFTESAETVYTGEAITFNASSSYDLDGIITSYFWDFGDGSNASGVTVQHAYADNGNYTVLLTVTDDDGATSNTTAIKTILNLSPTAIFTESAENVLTGQTISFNASASYDPDGSIVGYLWDFGDGSNATGIVTDHIYAEEGTFTVTLVVTDDDSATDTTTATKIIGNSLPVAVFTESAYTVYTGVVISFDASDSYDPDGSIVSYFWDFGDGTNATNISVGHAYSDNGTCTVTLTVTDDDGASSSSSAVKTVLNRAPVATFTESVTTVHTTTSIRFNASACYDPDGSIVTYFWDFGDGTNATGMAVVDHAYADDGNYLVTLTITDNDGTTSAATATKTVLNRSPVASFTESVETVLTDEIVTFNASASYDPDGYIVSYFWDFGDGTNATSIIVAHAYVDNGTYTTILTITDDDGASSSSSAVKTVLNRAPVATFTESAESVVVEETIYFNASMSYDLDGLITSYFWNFGDGLNATGITTEHSYADNGVYTVHLSVTDDDGAKTSTNSTKIVGITPPVASFVESTQSAYTGEIISFNASASYDTDGFIVSYFWDFGDGSNATGVIVDHSFTYNGTYTVMLTVIDDDGAPNTATSTKTILNRPPIALFTESAETVYIGQPITFNASTSYDPDGTITSYFWSFGDGSNATGVVVDHTYYINGTYTATLTISDNDEAIESTSAIKTILWNEQPTALFSESAETVYTGEIISFNASASYDPDGSIVSYFWDFGDSTNITGIAVEHVFVDNGTYTVTLTVTDNVEATNAAIATKTVFNRFPIANFTESAETVYTGEAITFNASSSYDLDGTIISFLWDFGDGNNATGIITSHSYADNGTYTVILTVTDNDGAFNSTTAIKTILNSLPVIAFTESAETIYVGQLITFNASACYDPDGNITSYLWDFGDGTNGAGAVVEHAYYLNGTFTVMLNATDDDGGSSTINATKTILWNEPPVALFTETAETIYQGESITFDATSSYDLDGVIVSYFWDLGDGINATDITVNHIYLDYGTYTVILIITDDIGEKRNTTSTKTVLNFAPIVLFTESAETVNTYETISFNASSCYDPDGSIISYFWDFGDGTNATGTTANHTFTQDGTFTVTLSITDDDGTTSSVTSVKTIQNQHPIAIFTFSPPIAYTGETITFNASASYDPDGSIVTYYWQFGDGHTKSGKTATHIYSDNGRYTVTLIIADDDIAQDTAITMVIISNRAPTATFTESSTTSYVGTTITFDASSSYDPDGLIVGYLWDFGDDANATGKSVSHLYLVNGTYTVTLTVTDDDGAASFVQATKTILENEWPTASFSESTETAYTNEIITFNASSSYDPDGTITNYSWDFGDGTETTGITTQHTYINNDIYTVTLTVTDNNGAANSINSTKTVLNRSPTPSFTETLETAYSGETIIFNADGSYDPDGSVVGYFWDFGDGSNASGIVVEHAYVVNGSFTVTLTVTDDDGAASFVQATKTILGGLHDVAIINVTPLTREIYKYNILNVTVIVANHGAEFETFNVTLYASEINGWHLIEVGERLLWYSGKENSANLAITTPIHIPTENPSLTFETKYSFENLYDFGFVQISLDGGVSWISLANPYTTYEHAETDADIISNLPGLTGSSGGWPLWTMMTFDLSQYAGEDAILGFRYMTDLGTLGAGWYIDNVTINGAIIPNRSFEHSNPSTPIAIETIAIHNLLPGTQAPLVFHWNTSQTLSGHYSISASASIVRGENVTSNNTYMNGPVEIRVNPDIDNDGDVDIFDVVAVTSIYGCREGEPRWNPKADLVEDGIIDIYDVVYVTSHY